MYQVEAIPQEQDAFRLQAVRYRSEAATDALHWLRGEVACGRRASRAHVVDLASGDYVSTLYGFEVTQ